MEGVERMYAGQTTFAKELHRLAIDAAIRPFFAAEFAISDSDDSPTFKSNEFSEEQATFCSPEQQRVILGTINTGHSRG